MNLPHIFGLTLLEINLKFHWSIMQISSLRIIIYLLYFLLYFEEFHLQIITIKVQVTLFNRFDELMIDIFNDNKSSYTSIFYFETGVFSRNASFFAISSIQYIRILVLFWDIYYLTWFIQNSKRFWIFVFSVNYANSFV